ncbi:MAG: extracellular solute-binding protein, partial [Chloroflexota bacterium]|nr:extracellular solute-binding protein [Chloroflexota bacterium]
MTNHNTRPGRANRSSRYSRRNVLKAGAAASLAVPVLGSGSAQAASKWSSVNMHLRRQDSITLQATVWLGDAEFEAMQELGAVFTESNPNVTIEFINIIDGGPWGRDQLQRMIAGGEPPDLMMMNTG